MIKFCLDSLNGVQGLEVINSTNIALIPKVKNPQFISQFRPISLSNVLYKIIAKVIVNRFKHVLPHCISDSQNAFVLRRLITDNVLVAYELLHNLKNKRKGKESHFALKFDMSKTYDKVKWGVYR